MRKGKIPTQQREKKKKRRRRPRSALSVIMQRDARKLAKQVRVLWRRRLDPVV
jgi:hypothetical protein